MRIDSIICIKDTLLLIPEELELGEKVRDIINNKLQIINNEK